MGAPNKHILRQLSVIKALGHTAGQALAQNLRGLPPRTEGDVIAPGATLVAHVPARDAELLRDYVRHVGGDPGAYKGRVPAHFFPQWTFPLAAETLVGLPYPLAKVVNGGCRVEVRSAIPTGERLIVQAQLAGVDENERRAVLHQRIVTGPADTPEALVVDQYPIVPLARAGGAGQKGGGQRNPRPAAAKERPRVPDDARELAYWRISASAGLDFAKLTGDFNPVHWVPAYARAAGFRHTILHGFATLARAWEGIQRALLKGSAEIVMMDVKFTKPLVLPAKVGLYVRGDGVWVGDAPGGPAYLAGTFATQPLYT
jgi:acyl dehydratase